MKNLRAGTLIDGGDPLRDVRILQNSARIKQVLKGGVAAARHNG